MVNSNSGARGLPVEPVHLTYKKAQKLAENPRVVSKDISQDEGIQ